MLLGVSGVVSARVAGLGNRRRLAGPPVAVDDYMGWENDPIAEGRVGCDVIAPGGELRRHDG